MLMFDIILFDNFYYNLITQAAGSVIGMCICYEVAQLLFYVIRK